MPSRIAPWLLCILLGLPTSLPARSLPSWWQQAPVGAADVEPAPSPASEEPEVLPAAEETSPPVLRLVSWNLLTLTTRSPIGQLAEVLARFDLAALQEVKQVSGLEKLRKELQARTGVIWYKSVSKKVGDGQKAEYMAFLYRTDRVRVVPGGPRGIYQPRRPEYFVRPPFYVTFAAGEFDFTLVNYHARWDRSDRITEEVARLAQVVQQIQGESSTEQDLILAGDFNVHTPDHKAFGPLREAGMTHLVDAEGQFSTYSTVPERVGASFYDNIWIDELNTLGEFTGQSGVLYLHDHYFQEEENPHLRIRVEISDHCPVWAEFATDRDDD